MIGNRVYGPLTRLEIKVNPIPHGAQWAKNKVHGTLIRKINENVQIYEQNICFTCILGPLVKVKRTSYWHNWWGKIWVWILPSISMDFQYKTFKDFFCLQIALTRSIFELEKCSFFSNRSEFRQKLIGNVISELCWQKCLWCRQSSWVLRDDASGANRCYVLAHCGGGILDWGCDKWVLTGV